MLNLGAVFCNAPELFCNLSKMIMLTTNITDIGRNIVDNHQIVFISIIFANGLCV